MKILLSIALSLGLISLLLNPTVCIADDDATAAGEAPTIVESAEFLTYEEVKKLPVKKLRKMLAKKGKDCKGCSEKADFVSLAFDSQNLPDIDVPPSEGPAQSPAATSANGDLPEGVSREKMDELMAKLKDQGFGNTKMFTADDLSNMSPEEMSEKLSGDRWDERKKKKKKSKKKKSNSGKKSSTSSTDTTGDEEHIEL